MDEDTPKDPEDGEEERVNPPRWTQELLLRLAPTERIDEVLGDLEEAHRGRLARRPRVLATLLTALDALDMSLALLRNRRSATSGVPLNGGPDARTRPGRRRPRLPLSLLDFKLGFRMLVRYPGLTVVGGLAMAFGIGIGAITFEAVKQILDPVIPLDEGDEIVGLLYIHATGAGEFPPTPFDFFTYRESLESVTEISAARGIRRNLIPAAGPGEPIEVTEMTASGFRVARVPPLLGRTILESDEIPGGPAVLVIGFDVWQSRFGGDDEAVGRTVRLGNTEHMVVGVMPEGFRFPSASSYWTPLRLRKGAYQPGEGPRMLIFGRLAPGARMKDAELESAALGVRMASDHPESHQFLRPLVVLYSTAVLPMPDIGPVGLMAINAFVAALIALICGNVALLMFARATTREGEIVIRNALGASRARIIAQLFAEALVLGVAAAALGLWASGVGMDWWLAAFEADMEEPLPFWFRDTLAPTTVAYGVVLTVLSATVAGVLPALKVTGRAGERRLRRASAGSGGLGMGGIWTAVIVAQVAITVAFPSTGFFFQRFIQVNETLDLGFPAEEFLAARLELDAETRPGLAPELAEAARDVRLGEIAVELERRLATEPAVAGVTFAQHQPGTLHRQTRIQVDGVDGGRPRPRPVLSGPARVTTDFFDVLGAPIRQGRGFGSGDLDSDVRSVIVNRSFVDQMLEGRNPIGRRVRYWRRGDPSSMPWFEIVGVVDDLGTIAGDMDPRDDAGFYHPMTAGGIHPVHVLVRVREDPADFAHQLRVIATGLEPTLRVHDVMPLDWAGEEDLFVVFFMVRMVTLVSSVALLLSFATIYSVTSFAVSRRTREIGVRLALGAESRRIVMTIFRRPIVQVGAGGVIGGLLAFFLSGVLTDGLTPGEVGTMIAYAAGMLLVCSFACIVPTRRALAIEPTDALRVDG